jgi:O-antigen/teichoic acid export membrane protein
MVPVLQLVLLRGLAWPIVLYGQSLLYGLGQPGRLLRVNLIDGLVNLALLGASVPFGLAAIALASSLRILGFLWPLLAVPIRTATGIGYGRQLALLAPAWVSAGLMALALFGLQWLLAPALGTVALVALQAGLGVVVYVGVSLITNRAVIQRLLGVLAAVWASRVQRQRAVSGA